MKATAYHSDGEFATDIDRAIDAFAGDVRAATVAALRANVVLHGRFRDIASQASAGFTRRPMDRWTELRAPPSGWSPAGGGE